MPPPQVGKAPEVKSPIAATLLALFGFAALTFGAVGDLSDSQYYDAPASASMITVFSIVLGLAVTALALTSLSRIALEVHRSVLPYLLLPFVAGAAVGAGLRVVTAHTVGANIGGGLVVICGPFVIVPLIVAALVTAKKLVPQPVSAPSPNTGTTTWPLKAMYAGLAALGSPVVSAVLLLFSGWLALLFTCAGPIAMCVAWKAVRTRITRRDSIYIAIGFAGGAIGTIWFMMAMIAALTS
jgi:hypothetical protein